MRVRGFARLRNHQQQSVFVKYWIAVTKFRGVIDINWNASQLLNHVLARQTRVP